MPYAYAPLMTPLSGSVCHGIKLLTLNNRASWPRRAPPRGHWTARSRASTGRRIPMMSSRARGCTRSAWRRAAATRTARSARGPARWALAFFFLVLGPWPLVLGLWSLVFDPWSLVLGLCSGHCTRSLLIESAHQHRPKSSPSILDIIGYQGTR